jgi:oligoribonuclease
MVGKKETVMEKIFWADLEMTGLDLETSVIIEFACIVTDLDFKELGIYDAVVYQPQAELDKMDEWNTRTHGESGLTAQVPFGKPLNRVETEIIDFLNKYFSGDPIILAGNSISQDRIFIDKYMKDLSQKLHYRIIDVSSFKQIFKYKFDIDCNEKKGNHRALDDIRESIAELKHYLTFVSK